MPQGSRRMFTAERRMLERAGQLPSESSSEMPDDLSQVIREHINAAIQGVKAEIVEEVRRALNGVAGVASDPTEAQRIVTEREVAALKAEHDELQKKTEEMALVKNEIRALTYSIQSTKKEIAALYRAQGSENRLEVVASELDGVVQDTEIATQNIMDIAESIDDLAERLQAIAEGSGTIQDIAEEISGNTVRLFESCNFQDLTGQRINKVVNTLQLIDDRLSKVVSIWGPEDIEEMEVEADPTGLDGLTKIVNQRSVEIERVTQDEADALMSQDDLDALFG